MKPVPLVLGAAICFAQSSIQIQTNGPLAGGPSTTRFVIGQPFTVNVVTRQPFIAEAVVETDQTLADGSYVVNKETSSVARDSYGRTYREEVLASSADSGRRLKRVFISDPVAQVNYVLEPDHIAKKIPISMLGAQAGVISISINNAPPQEAQTGQLFWTARPNIGRGVQTGPPSTQTVQQSVLGETKTEPLGTQMIAGVQADGSRATLTIPVGRVGNQNPVVIADERWFSQELQATVLTRHTDPRFGKSTYQLTNIQRTEPSVSMFQVPSDYAIEEPQSR